MHSKPSLSALTAPLGLLDTVRAIDSGTLTPEESLQTCLDRIKVHDGIVKAFCHMSSDETVLNSGKSGPLKGISFGVKDVFDTADLPTEHNSPIYQGHNAGWDASIVAMAKAAGAGLLGKTVTTEFAFFHPGSTRNPHNLDHTPGGSSSGSAAAIASGMAHFSIGTQTGGSVIRPASFCGIAGYKPSAGLLPTVGMKTFSWSLDTTGLFASGIEDVAYVASVLTGRHLRTDKDDAPISPKLGIFRSHLWGDADKAYKQQFEDLLKSLSRFGAQLVEIPTTEEYIAAFHAHQMIQDFEARQALRWEYETHADQLSPVLRQTLDFAQTISATDYDEARVSAEIGSLQVDDAFEDVDAFISLSAPGPAPAGLESTGSSVFNRTWTLFGLPSLNVPGLKSEEGLPLGVQIIGPYMSDQKTLCIAQWLEGAIKRHLDTE